MKFKRKRNKGEEKFLVWVVMVVEVLWRGGRVHTFFSINGIDSQTWTMNQSFTIAAHARIEKTKTKQTTKCLLSIYLLYLHARICNNGPRQVLCVLRVCWLLGARSSR
jgi:hypothetical protein